MKLSHVIILAASILIGCSAIALSNLVFDRYAYRTPLLHGRLSRVDKMTGAVETYHEERGWVNVRYP